MAASDDSSDYVPVRVSRVASSSSSSGSVPETTDEKIKEVMSNPEQIEKIVREVGKNPEIMDNAIGAIQEDPNLKRKARRFANRTDIQQQVGKLSMREKKKLLKQYKQANQRASVPSMVGQGYGAVNVSQGRKFKNVTLEGPDFIQSPKYQTWKIINLGAGYFMAYDPEDKTKNRLASRIAGDSVGSQNIIYKLDDNGQYLHLDKGEVELHFK